MRSSIAAVSSPHSVLCTYNRRVRLIFAFKFSTPGNISYRQTTRVWSSAAAWKTNRSLENTLSGYKSTETVSWLSRNLRKAPTLLRWSCQHTSSSVAAQNILISRVSIWERHLLWHSGISPLATSNHTNISVQRIKSWKIILKPPHFVQFWCGRAMLICVGVTSKIVNNL